MRSLDEVANGGFLLPNYWLRPYRALKRILEEELPLGIFITMYEPTRGMTKEANGMGLYKDSFGNEYPKMQFITVRNIIEDGKKPDLPQIKPHGDK